MVSNEMTIETIAGREKKVWVAPVVGVLAAGAAEENTGAIDDDGVNFS